MFSGDISLQDIEISIDSALNEDILQFTLTCISTGGPATAVIWTKDNIVVAGGVKILKNPFTAQYTHKLTISGRLEGSYVCNVSNNKPSVATTELTVEGIECINVYNIYI